MPTIEIISIDSVKFEINQADFDFAIIREEKLKSHRGLFYNFLLKYKGTIVHLGNPEFMTDKTGAFFGEKLINWDYDNNDKFQFSDKYKDSVFKLLVKAYISSETNQAIILTDIQDNYPKARFKRFDSVKGFIKEHDKYGLDWNTAYLINFQNIKDSLYSEIDSILWNDWDPIGINDDGGPDDEYRDYVPEILKLVQESKSEQEIAIYLDKIVTEMIGLNSNIDENIRIARLLITAKQNDI